MKIFKLNAYKEYSIFIWLILITLAGVFVSTIYSSNKEKEYEKIKSTLDNIYLKKTLKEISQNLDPRYETVYYISKSGDTIQSIIDNLKINNQEKKLLIKTIKKDDSFRILKINQKFKFKFDNISDQKVVEFTIETDKKNEIQFTNKL